MAPLLDLTLQVVALTSEVLDAAPTPAADRSADADDGTLHAQLREAAAKVTGEDSSILVEHPVLGRVRLQLEVHARQLEIHAWSSSHAAREALRDAEARFRESVERHGVQLRKLRVEHDHGRGEERPTPRDTRRA